jgi:hypothetical protein
MSSDGLEERDFKLKLAAAILGIGALGDWIEPEYVLIREDDSELKDFKFPKACILCCDFSTFDEPHKFSTSGQITFSCMIHVAVWNTEDVLDSIPSGAVGLNEGPSLPLIDGALRNAFHLFNFDGWCMDTELGRGDPIPGDKIPAGCFGRSYSFKAIKEITR